MVRAAVESTFRADIKTDPRIAGTKRAVEAIKWRLRAITKIDMDHRGPMPIARCSCVFRFHDGAAAMTFLGLPVICPIT